MANPKTIDLLDTIHAELMRRPMRGHELRYTRLETLANRHDTNIGYICLAMRADPTRFHLKDVRGFDAVRPRPEGEAAECDRIRAARDALKDECWRLALPIAGAAYAERLSASPLRVVCRLGIIDGRPVGYEPDVRVAGVWCGSLATEEHVARFRRMVEIQIETHEHRIAADREVVEAGL